MLSVVSLLDALPLFLTPSSLGPISIPKMLPALCTLAHSGRTVVEEKFSPFCSGAMSIVIEPTIIGGEGIRVDANTWVSLWLLWWCGGSPVYLVVPHCCRRVLGSGLNMIKAEGETTYGFFPFSAVSSGVSFPLRKGGK